MTELSADKTLAGAQERARYARESHRMALELYDFIPFHPFKWRKQAKEVARRIKVLERANAPK